ncbi:hypothetical protein GNY06_03990 [Elizabethkingia argentiflava]|uniref:Uncharacterized protein n=1 Tax=Elizabethkingia argenteiflava TaxID=2681556 RepID=A0A845PQK5_9FLAO|nr:hypothetical protein [Elizabethkingia argenteiflava]NAW50579.1 hypothetical protein [Elizabethkingia argenteiflava]
MKTTLIFSAALAIILSSKERSTNEVLSIKSKQTHSNTSLITPKNYIASAIQKTQSQDERKFNASIQSVPTIIDPEKIVRPW